MVPKKVNKSVKELLKFAASSGPKLLSREGSFLEFKESFNWGSKDEYAKTAAAFANAKGGVFIFGVKNKPRELVGLLSDSFDDLESFHKVAYRLRQRDRDSAMAHRALGFFF